MPCALQAGEASVAQGVEAVRKRLEKALNQLETGSLSDEDTLKQIESYKARWPSVPQAQAELTNSRRKPQELQPQSGNGKPASSSTPWTPRIGDSVRVLRIGNSIGRVSHGCHMGMYPRLALAQLCTSSSSANQNAGASTQLSFLGAALRMRSWLRLWLQRISSVLGCCPCAL